MDVSNRKFFPFSDPAEISNEHKSSIDIQLYEPVYGFDSREWKYLPQAAVEIPTTKPVALAPAGLIRIPGGDFDFIVHGIEGQGGNDAGVDVPYP
jgi:hypothetical protein